MQIFNISFHSWGIGENPAKGHKIEDAPCRTSSFYSEFSENSEYPEGSESPEMV